jgi:hypothetical protein
MVQYIQGEILGISSFSSFFFSSSSFSSSSSFYFLDLELPVLISQVERGKEMATFTYRSYSRFLPAFPGYDDKFGMNTLHFSERVSFCGLGLIKLFIVRLLLSFLFDFSSFFFFF